MAYQNVPVFSQEEQKALRLNICKGCIYSECNGNRVNKCQVEDLVCVKDNNQKIVVKANDLRQVCPMNHWDTTNQTKKITVTTKSSGCGCGK